MKQDTETIIHTLRERGYRITTPRVALIEWLQTQEKPLPVRDIIAGTSLDTVTTYRILTMLRTEKFLEEIILPNRETAYALSHHHHHHLICEKCNLVTHIDCSTPEPLVRDTHFLKTVTRHEVTYYGVCARCY
jgi:Fur family transcriptional regulator, ferric uptake regulator